MGRKRTIDRNAVLDGAESIVQDQGAAFLTIDAVAKAAGISKGGVQYCFATKEKLVEAMFERWGKQFEEETERRMDGDRTPLNELKASIELTREADNASNARAVPMLSLLVQTREYQEKSHDWFRDRLAGLDFSTEEGRRLRIAFLAHEAIYLLRSFNMISLDDAEWSGVFDDILALLTDMDVAERGSSTDGASPEESG